MGKKIDYTGQQFGSRIVIRNYCINEDWKKNGMKIPRGRDTYKLTKCLNCGTVLPSNIKILQRQPPKRCVFCSNIGNHSFVETNVNSWCLNDDTAICNLMYHGEVISFYIDESKYTLANKYTWRISKKKNKYYVVTGSIKKGTMVYLHQLILGKKEGYEIDHIDGNSLNNRKGNLRYVTHQENVSNTRAIRIDNKIGIRGVSYDKKSKKYVVDFRHLEKRYYVKPWNTVEEAVYCRKCLEDYFGLDMLIHNPLYDNYRLEDKKKREEIKQYVLSKISQKGR